MLGADFSLAWGEVHALLGENGAGKSTLMNVLAGFYTADAGVVEVDGKAARFEIPAAAADAGIGMIHQHYKLVGPLTVMENLRLACAKRAGWKTQGQALAAMETLGAQLGFRLRPKSRVDELAVSDRQKLEIMKVLLAGARILIMDEPTAVLTEVEAKAALGLARSLAQGGRAVVLITHKLRDVLGYSDRVTVMRGGKTVLDGVASAGMTGEFLSRAMVGVEPVAAVPRAVVRPEREILRMLRVSAAASEHGVPLHDVNLDVRGGEILGIAGVGGNGQAELVEVLVGLRKAYAGDVIFNESTAPVGPARRRAAGLRFVPADRMGMGLFGELGLNVNVAVPRLLGWLAEKKFFVGSRWMDGLAVRAIEEFEVAGGGTKIPVRLLSGGNAQKLMLAREFGGSGFSMLVAHSPTRGLDIRAVQAVQARLRAATAQNVAVLLISEDLDEIFEMSDRVAVMSHGRLSAAEPIGDVDRGKIGRLMLEMA